MDGTGQESSLREFAETRGSNIDVSILIPFLSVHTPITLVPRGCTPPVGTELTYETKQRKAMFLQTWWSQ